MFIENVNNDNISNYLKSYDCGYYKQDNNTFPANEKQLESKFLQFSCYCNNNENSEINEEEIKNYYALNLESKDSYILETKSDCSIPNTRITLKEKNTKIFLITKDKLLNHKRAFPSKSNTKFTQNEDNRLLFLKANFNYLSWKDIASHFENKTSLQCSNHYENVLLPGKKKGKWTEEEDSLVLNWVRKNGAKSWSKLNLKGRTSKQIRERWINNLQLVFNKNQKFKWNSELDKLLLNLYMAHGTKWVYISQEINKAVKSEFKTQSTENIVKNRFYCLLRSTASKYNKLYKLKRSNDEGIDSFFTNQQLNKYESNENAILLENDAKSESCQPDKKPNSIYSKSKKRVFSSISDLVNYLPYLLKEKKLEHLIVDNKNYEENFEYKEDKLNLYSKLLDNNSSEKRKKALKNVIDIINTKRNEVVKTQNDLKMKNFILLNLQISVMNKILNRIKIKKIRKFFSHLIE